MSEPKPTPAPTVAPAAPPAPAATPGGVPITFSGDVQLVGWADSHTQGPIVKMRLQDSEELEVFRHMTMAKGNQGGDLFRMVLVKLDEEGKPTPPAIR